MNMRIVRGQITPGDLYVSMDPYRADVRRNCGGVGIPPVPVEDTETNPVAAVGHLVHEQVRRPVAVHDYKVQPAIVVDIPRRHTSTGVDKRARRTAL